MIKARPRQVARLRVCRHHRGARLQLIVDFKKAVGRIGTTGKKRRKTMPPVPKIQCDSNQESNLGPVSRSYRSQNGANHKSDINQSR